MQYQQTLDLMGACDPHELMRCLEVHFIRDCAEMAASASLYRQETRWGLYHYRLDYPEKNDDVIQIRFNTSTSPLRWRFSKP